MFVFVYAPSVLAICFAPCTSLAHDLSPACPLVGSLSLALLLALFPTPSLLKFLSCVARCTLQAGRPDPYAYVPFDKRQINKKKSHQPKKTLSKVVVVCVPVFVRVHQRRVLYVCCMMGQYSDVGRGEGSGMSVSSSSSKPPLPHSPSATHHNLNPLSTLGRTGARN